MSRFLMVFIGSVFILLILSTCQENNPVGPDPDGDNQTPSYTLTVNVSPNDNAGSINILPDKDSYEENEEVTLTANSADGWQFESWSGSGVSSSENTYQITMDSDKTVTATFSQVTNAELFTAEMEIWDGSHSRKVTLVSDDDGNVQNTLDVNDIEGPPIAPPGVFFVGSVVDNMILYKDVRLASSKIIWTIQLYRENGKSVSFNNFTLSKELNGSLTLVDDPDVATPNIDINMQSSSGYSISDPSIEYLYVVYQAQDPAKMIAGDFYSGFELKDEE